MFIGATYFTSAYFGQGSGPIFMDDVVCGSSDTVLLACSYDRNTSDGYHGNDVSVRCGGELLIPFARALSTLFYS